jgi:hypothetical protein
MAAALSKTATSSARELPPPVFRRVTAFGAIDVRGDGTIVHVPPGVQPGLPSRRQQPPAAAAKNHADVRARMWWEGQEGHTRSVGTPAVQPSPTALPSASHRVVVPPPPPTLAEYAAAIAAPRNPPRSEVRQHQFSGMSSLRPLPSVPQDDVVHVVATAAAAPAGRRDQASATPRNRVPSTASARRARSSSTISHGSRQGRRPVSRSALRSAPTAAPLAVAPAPLGPHLVSAQQLAREAAAVRNAKSRIHSAAAADRARFARRPFPGAAVLPPPPAHVAPPLNVLAQQREVVVARSVAWTVPDRTPAPTASSTGRGQVLPAPVAGSGSSGPASPHTASDRFALLARRGGRAPHAPAGTHASAEPPPVPPDGAGMLAVTIKQPSASSSAPPSVIRITAAQSLEPGLRMHAQPPPSLPPPSLQAPPPSLSVPFLAASVLSGSESVQPVPPGGHWQGDGEGKAPLLPVALPALPPVDVSTGDAEALAAERRRRLGVLPALTGEAAGYTAVPGAASPVPAAAPLTAAVIGAGEAASTAARPVQHHQHGEPSSMSLAGQLPTAADLHNDRSSPLLQAHSDRIRRRDKAPRAGSSSSLELAPPATLLPQSEERAASPPAGSPLHAAAVHQQQPTDQQEEKEQWPTCRPSSAEFVCRGESAGLAADKGRLSSAEDAAGLVEAAGDAAGDATISGDAPPYGSLSSSSSVQSSSVQAAASGMWWSSTVVPAGGALTYLDPDLTHSDPDALVPPPSLAEAWRLSHNASRLSARHSAVAAAAITHSASVAGAHARAAAAAATLPKQLNWAPAGSKKRGAPPALEADASGLMSLNRSLQRGGRGHAGSRHAENAPIATRLANTSGVLVTRSSASDGVLVSTGTCKSSSVGTAAPRLPLQHHPSSTPYHTLVAASFEAAFPAAPSPHPAARPHASAAATATAAATGRRLAHPPRPPVPLADESASMSLADAVLRAPSGPTELETLHDPASRRAEGLVHAHLSRFSNRLRAAERAYSAALAADAASSIVVE